MKRFSSITNDRTRRVARGFEIAVGGSGFSPAEQKFPLTRLQPLKLRLIVPLSLMFPLVLALGALLFTSATVQAQQQAADPALAGNAQTGKKNFTSNGCYECHGLQGQGATQTGAARIGPPQLSLESFLSYVRHPVNQMPPYSSKAISDQDLTDRHLRLLEINSAASQGKRHPLAQQVSGK